LIEQCDRWLSEEEGNRNFVFLSFGSIVIYFKILVVPKFELT